MLSICMEASRLLIALTEYIMFCMGLLVGEPPQNIFFFKSTIFITISSVKLKLLTALLEYLTAHSEYMAALLEHIDLKSKVELAVVYSAVLQSWACGSIVIVLMVLVACYVD